MNRHHACPDCRRHKDEILRLRAIITQLDREKLRALQQRAAFVEEMTNQMNRWREAQDMLIAGRP